MPRLLLLRHAKAISHSPDGDFARELSPRGRKDAARLGSWLRAQNIIPDAALVSPARRTRETAELLLHELQAAPQKRFDEDLYNASAGTLLSALTRARGECMLIIAHNPGIGDLAHRLAAQDANDAVAKLAEGFPTCTLAIFETNSLAHSPLSSHFRLVTYMSPALIA